MRHFYSGTQIEHCSWRFVCEEGISRNTSEVSANFCETKLISLTDQWPKHDNEGYRNWRRKFDYVVELADGFKIYWNPSRTIFSRIT